MLLKARRGATLATIATVTGMVATLGAGTSSAAGMKPGADSWAKIKSGTQTVRSGIAGVDRSGDRGCYDNNTYNAIVTWKLGKVTKSSIRVKSIDIRHSNGRAIHVGNYALVDDNSRRWNKVNPGNVAKGAHHRKYKINKTLKVKSHKAYLIAKTQISYRQREDSTCQQPVYLYFYLKQKR
ncbi:hypothetical protein AB0H82_22725 [Streptomyces sp. NPDC050732]|uniref:hypothetical protein n=1 Tax=Streptomyces sp. NPDC050732 TaxID=3154632 RepID=UPI0034297B8A